MILGSGMVLEAVLSGAVAANQPKCHVDAVGHDKHGVQDIQATQRVVLNSTTDVALCSYSLFVGFVEVLGLWIYNKDTANVTVTVKTSASGGDRILVKQTLLPDETLGYSNTIGWYVL